MTTRRVPIGRRGIVLVMVTLSMIALADWLFYGYVLGISAAVFLLTVIAAVVIRHGRVASSRPGWLLAGVLVALAGTMAVEPGVLSMLLAISALAVWVFSERLGWTPSMRAWTQRALGAVLWMMWQPIHDGRVQYRWQQRRGPRRGVAILARNWLVPLLLTGVFVLLFRAANPVLGSWVDEAGVRLGSALEDLNQLLAPERIVLWLIIGFAGWSLLRNRPTTQRHDAYAPPPPFVNVRGCFAWVDDVFRCEEVAIEQSLESLFHIQRRRRTAGVKAGEVAAIALGIHHHGLVNATELRVAHHAAIKACMTGQ